jgi:lipopolysaccharide/colanic/teichoic acid biosynthesis glycosyltransferase
MLNELVRIVKIYTGQLALIVAFWISFLCGVKLIYGLELPSDGRSLYFFSASHFVVGASVLAFCVLHLVNYFAPSKLFPRMSDLLLVAWVLPFSGIIQYVLQFSLSSAHPYPFSATIILGMPLSAAIFGIRYAFIWRSLEQGTKKIPIVLDLLPNEKAELFEELESVGLKKYIEFLSVANLKEFFVSRRENEVQLIVISRGAARSFSNDAYLARAHLAGIPIVDRRELITDCSGRIKMLDSDSWSFVLTATRQTPLLRLYSEIKIVSEPFAAVVLGVILLPVMLLTALMIRLTSKGPVLYRQLRTGYLGKPFYLVKFRSMRTDSESNGPQWANDQDSRVTPVGKIIRKTRMDELPQLWNVIRGEMSFFGPRPERPEFYESLKKNIPLFPMRTVIRPGITGWAQVCAGYAASIEESRLKLEYDLYYLKHVSPRMDVIILLKTAKVAVGGLIRNSEKVPAIRKAKDSHPSASQSEVSQ